MNKANDLNRNEKDERVDIETAAIYGIELSNNMGMIQHAFLDPNDKQLAPFVMLFHQAWANNEPERILAFFYRDNPTLIPIAKQMLGLHVLEWSGRMMEQAVEEDSFAKLAVLALAGEKLPGDLLIEFNKAVQADRMGYVNAAIAFQGPEIVSVLGSNWPSVYSKLTAKKGGMDYLAGQLLVGAVSEYDPKAFKAGVPLAAEAEDPQYPIATRIGYIEAMAMPFSPRVRPHAAMEAIVVPMWEEYEPA
jgi:hypothetical protein